MPVPGAEAGPDGGEIAGVAGEEHEVSAPTATVLVMTVAAAAHRGGNHEGIFRN
jgi:hypothetical protein